MPVDRSLDEQRTEFSRRRLIATPIAGAIAWTTVGISALFLKGFQIALVLFIAMGMVMYLGLFISRFTGENFLAKDRPKNTFDKLFFYTVAMSLLVYAIAIPFFLVDYTSLPLTVGILTGLMWLPVSWIIQHWIGLAHAVVRTVAVTAVWYLFPEERFLFVPLVIVLIYAITIPVLEMRWRSINTATIQTRGHLAR